ncbi:MAG: DNA repair protein RadC [Candidatus Kapabacteria bacterium]|nr:DNA repair protein RadC [Candidatus Kapabacteria bacterium]
MMLVEKVKSIEHKSDFMPIKQWREDDRPRERLIKFGSKSLSDSELLAIIIGFGTVGKSAIDISRSLLSEFSSLSEMAKCDVTQFKKISGIGLAKAVTISAAFELSRRISDDPFSNNKILSCCEDVVEYYMPRLRDFRTECFRVILLDNSNRPFKEVTVSEGILNQTLVHPREVFRQAILESAASIILLHNHPSGNCQPSPQDKDITKRLLQTGDIVGISVLDHIIIGRNNYFSFKNASLL